MYESSSRINLRLYPFLCFQRSGVGRFVSLRVHSVLYSLLLAPLFLHLMGKRRASTNSCGNQHESSWAPEEHQRFLLALEQFGRGQCTSIDQAWQQITAAVGTRDTVQVVYHARLYFAHLQFLHMQTRQYMQSVDETWSSNDNAVFEDMLATYTSSSVCYPWDVMASRLPGKSPTDLKERYQKLCHDVARIENGHEVAMPSRHARLACLSPSIGATSGSMTSPRVLDSVITLTPLEEQILINAMADVFVPPQAPADLLAGIASAVAAFTSSNGRVPPQRNHSKFTKEQALEVLNRLLAAQQSEPQIVLETLASELHLRPRSLDISTSVSFSSNSSEEPTSVSTGDPLNTGPPSEDLASSRHDQEKEIKG